MDELADFETLSRTTLRSQAPTRYAVRQVLDQELHKVSVARAEASRQARFQGGEPANSQATMVPPLVPTASSNKENIDVGDKSAAKVKRDFFGRIIKETAPLKERDMNRGSASSGSKVRVWVKYNEGLNNAVRRPITLNDFMKAL